MNLNEARTSTPGRTVGDVVLAVEGVSLAFGGVKALTDVSFDVREHEIRAIIGPNGAGKSSMLNVINGVYHPHAGRITYLGKTHAQRLQEEVGLHHQVAAREDVLQHRHALEEREALEGARDALHGGTVRIHVLARLAAEGDPAVLRPVDAVDDVQHRALACPVGPDDGAHLVLMDVERHIGERLHAAEGERDALHREHHPADLAAGRGGGALVQVHAAFLAALAAKVFAGCTPSSARTLPVRPSSNRTWASTKQWSVPE